MKGQPHLLAISQRAAISEHVTDVILRRGEREVVRSVARNLTAAFSLHGYSSLVQRSADDGMLAVAMGQREDLPAPLLQQLMSESVDLVRRKMFQAASPARKAKLARTMVEMVADGDTQSAHRDYAPAQKTIVELHTSGELNQEALAKFARERKFEETVAALAAISGLTVDAVDQIISGGKRDSILILGRALDPGMGDRSPAAGAAPGARPQSVGNRRGRGARQLRAPRALDRAADAEVLERPRAGLGLVVWSMIPGSSPGTSLFGKPVSAFPDHAPASAAGKSNKSRGGLRVRPCGRSASSCSRARVCSQSSARSAVQENSAEC